jgi:hypothetical protein
MALPLLQWARRDPVIITRAREYLRKNGPEYGDPGTQFFRWLFEPENRRAVLADRAPNPLLQRVLLFASRKHPTERWVLSRKFPRFYRAPGALERKMAAFLMRALMFPPAGQLETAARVSPQPIGFDSMLLITAALRRLAGDTSANAARLAEFAGRRRQRFSCEADFYEWIYPIVADLFFTTTFGLARERERAASAFFAIRYEGRGWLRGARLSVNIFDTALTVLALRAIGVTEDRTIVRNACDFLIAARAADGLWSWADDRGEGGHRGQPDSDDTGAACMALACVGSTTRTAAAGNTVVNLSSMQEKDGSFITFGRDVPRPNWRWISNTSRSLQGLLGAGVDRRDLRIDRGVQWLRSQQLQDGSWVDGWCARYIYGTAMAVEALMRAGAAAQDRAIQGAIDWLLKQQNSDGGWGEDWYGGRSRSTPEHTGLAVYAFCLAADAREDVRHAIETGTQWLVGAQRSDGAWDASYFVDFGFGVGFADSQMPVVWALHGLGNAIRVLAGH